MNKNSPFSIPIVDTWYIENHSCPNCEEKYGFHSDLYTDGIIESCGYCGYTREVKGFKKKIIFKKHITRQDVNNNLNFLYVFGDNDAHKGMGGLAKECRGAKNSFGIRVKKYPSLIDDAFYNDGELENNIRKIDEDINNLLKVSKSYGAFIFSNAPIGSGLANLPKRAPRTYEYLIKTLKEKVGVNYGNV